MINKKGLIIIFIVCFIIINIFSINAFYNNFMGNKLYNKKGFEESIKYFDSANNLDGIYNKGNAFYKQKKYSDAIKEYKSILGNKKSDLNFRLNHNVANSFYRIGEEENKLSLKIKNWEKSVKYYEDALNIKYNEQTKKNLEFVLDKIKKEKKKQEKGKNKEEKQNKKENNQKNNQDNKDKNTQKESKKQDKTSQDNNKDNKKEGNTSKDSKDSKSTKGGDKSKSNPGVEKNKQGKGSENQKNLSKKQDNNLTKSQEQALKQYQEALKQEQNKNSDNFNKVYKENTQKDPFADFFNDPFFNNDLLNQGSGKKDW